MEKSQGKSSINGNAEVLLKLSRREGEVLILLAKEKTNREVADELYLSIRTVETHRYRICKKLELEGKGMLQKWLDEHWNGNQKEE